MPPYIAAAEAPMHPLTLRRLRPSERRLLRAKLRTSTLPVRPYQWYRIVAEAGRSRTVPEIADRVGCHPQTACLWLHLFNTSGFETFERSTNPWGREPVRMGPQVRELVKVALSRPADLGLPFTEWSTAKLTAYCKQRGLLPPITDEWVQRVLRREGVTPQRLKTWKASPDRDPEYRGQWSSLPSRGGLIFSQDLRFTTLGAAPLRPEFPLTLGHPPQKRQTDFYVRYRNRDVRKVSCKRSTEMDRGDPPDSSNRAAHRSLTLLYLNC